MPSFQPSLSARPSSMPSSQPSLSARPSSMPSSMPWFEEVGVGFCKDGKDGSGNRYDFVYYYFSISKGYSVELCKNDCPKTNEFRGISASTTGWCYCWYDISSIKWNRKMNSRVPSAPMHLRNTHGLGTHIRDTLDDQLYCWDELIDWVGKRACCLDEKIC
eukprot:scaffold18699_cov45-Cyclotella_meneghiniana.AAC.1